MSADRKTKQKSIGLKQDTIDDLQLLADQAKRNITDYIRLKLEEIVEKEEENLSKLRGSK